MSPPNVLRFVVLGEPVPKGRARTRVVTPKAGGPAFATHFTPKDTRHYERKIQDICALHVNRSRWAWHDRDRFVVRVIVCRTHEGKGGDWDNYAKSALDAMNRLAFPDDRRVRQCSVWIVHDPKNPRMVVEVTRYRLGQEVSG